MQDDSQQGENNDNTSETEGSVRDESVVIKERSRLETAGHPEIRERPEVKRELEPISRADSVEDAEEKREEEVVPLEAEREEPEYEAEDAKTSVEEAPVSAETPVAIPPVKTSLAEEMSKLTSEADTPVTNQKLSSLSFPWFRTVLVGFLIPILTALLVAIVYAVIGQPLTLGAMTTASGWLVVVPAVSGLLTVLIAAGLLKRIHVGRAFFLAAGTLICSAGIITVVVNEVYPGLYALGWGAVALGGSELWAALLLVFTGAVVILTLLFIVHTLGRYLPKLFTAVLFLAIVAAPWLVHFYGDDLGIISQKSDIITASADAA